MIIHNGYNYVDQETGVSAFTKNQVRADIIRLNLPVLDPFLSNRFLLKLYKPEEKNKNDR